MRPALFRLAAVLLLLLPPLGGAAAEPSVILAGTPLGAAELDAVRGGYSGSGKDGLRLSFDLERRVYVNGELESSTVLYTSGALPGGAPADYSTVLQNTLDHQQLRTMTLLEVRMSGYDPVAVSRFDSMRGAQMFTTR